MATKSTNPNAETEETEPVADQDDDGVNGIEGQIIYPDAEVDAERAGAWVAGKEDTLYEDDEDNERMGWQNPADRPTEEQTDDKDEDE
jgi:hypothetical protein